MSRLLKKFLNEHKGEMFRFYLESGEERFGKLIDFDESYLTINPEYNETTSLIRISAIVEYKNFIC